MEAPSKTMSYGFREFRADLLAGLTVATVAVPQGMAYALIAGIEPHYGLYTAIVMTALASIFGSSGHLINGPTNAISLVVFGAVDSLTHGPTDPQRIQIVTLLAVLVGLIQILIAILKLGDLTRYVSEAVVLGFMAGAGLLVALSQIHGLLGLKPQGTGEDHFLYRLWLTLRQGGSVNPVAVTLGVITIGMIFLFHQLGRLLKLRLPELLLTLILVSVGAWWLELAPPEEIGHLQIPRELPSFSLPSFSPDRIRTLWGGALAIALLGLVEALAIAKALAARTRQRLDYNQQCLAEGIANLGGGLFQCMPGSGSLTRSTINYVAGAATRVSGVISAAAVAATLLLFAPLAKFIPQPALAGVILWTAWRIVDRPRLLFCLKATRFDAGLAVATALSAVLLSIEFSILIGVFLSFLFFVPRASRLQATELIASKERVLRERRPEDPVCNRLVILGVEGQLFFGASPEFEQILSNLETRVRQGVRVIVLGFRRSHNPDMVCLEHLQHFLHSMHQQGVVVLLCGIRPDFWAVLTRLGFTESLGADRIYREENAADHSEGPILPSALRAVKRAYEILGEDLCATCPKRQEGNVEKEWYYVI